MTRGYLLPVDGDVVWRVVDHVDDEGVALLDLDGWTRELSVDHHHCSLLA